MAYKGKATQCNMRVTNGVYHGGTVLVQKSEKRIQVNNMHKMKSHCDNKTILN